MGGEKKRKKEKETLWVLIAAAVLVATDAADEPDLEVKRFFFCHRTSVLIQPRPCGVSVGVSEAAAGPLGEGGRRCSLHPAALSCSPPLRSLNPWSSAPSWRLRNTDILIEINK